MRDRHGLGVEGRDHRAFREEGPDQGMGRGFADVIGIGLEGEPPDGKALAR
ncbi:hypothetical protein D3C85_1718820 [compost metagenome]